MTESERGRVGEVEYNWDSGGGRKRWKATIHWYPGVLAVESHYTMLPRGLSSGKPLYNVTPWVQCLNCNIISYGADICA